MLLKGQVTLNLKISNFQPFFKLIAIQRIIFLHFVIIDSVVLRQLKSNFPTDRQTDKQTNYLTPYMGVYQFFLRAKFSTSLLALLAGRIVAGA